MSAIHHCRRAAVLFSVALALFATALSAAITGVVVDDDGAPIAGVNVAAFPQETARALAARVMAGKLERDPLASAATAADGSFRLDVAQPVIELAVIAGGRQPFFADAASGEDFGTIVLPQSKPSTIHVVAPDGKPVAGAVVISARYLAKTAQDGTVTLPGGTSTSISVFHPDYAITDASLLLPNASPQVKLTRGVMLKGRVTSADGRTPVAHAIVSAGFYATAETAADGSFAIAHAPQRWQMLSVISPAGAAFIPYGSATTFDIRVRPAAALEGSVREGKSRSGVAGARVVYFERGRSIDATITDAKGNFSFAALPPGSGNVIVQHPLMQLQMESAPYGGPNMRPGFFGPGASVVTVTSGARASVALVAEPLAVIHGHVLDEERKPVSAAMITVASMQATRLVAFTNPKGEFTLRAPGSGGAAMQISKSGFMPSMVNTIGKPAADVAVTLRRGIPIIVKTVDAEKKPVSDVIVSMLPAVANENRRAESIVRCGNAPCMTGADGSVEVRVAPGMYNVRVGGKTVVPKAFPAQKVAEDSSPLVLSVERGVEVSGRVVYTDGSPVQDATVVVRADGGIETGAQTDVAGTFSLANAPRGALTVSVIAQAAGGQSGPSKQVNAPVSDIVLTMPPSGRIAGTVVDSSTRQPISDFQITPKSTFTIARPQSFSAGDGTFALEHIPAGKVDLEATAAGYTRGSVAGVEVIDGKTTSGVEVRLDPAARITGHVTSQDGTVLSGVFVAAVESGTRRGATVDSAMTDANGDYTLSSVPAGDRRIAFTKQGYLRQEKSVTADVGKDSHLDAVLEQGLDLRGRVTDDGGAPVSDAMVRIQATGESSIARSDADGSFVLSGLRSTPYTVLAHKNGYTEGRVENATPGGAVVTLTLRRGATITGHVTGIAPAAAASVMISVHGPGVASSGRADASGNFSISGVPDGHFFVSGTLFQPGASPRRSADVTVDVTNGTADPVEVVFRDGFTIQGRVTTNGNPASGGMVSFQPSSAGAQSGNGMIGSDGTYSVTGVTAGDYRVAVNLPSTNYGYAYSTKYTVSGSGTFDIDMRAGSLAGHVVDAQTNAPLTDAQITVTPLTPGALRQGRTDSTGAYSFDPLVEGQWRLNVQKDGYQAEVREVTVSGPTTADVQLAPGTKLTIHILDASNGQPLSANVVAVNTSKSLTYRTSAGIDGIAEVWLPAGSYRLAASAIQYVSDPVEVTAPGADAEIRMTRTGRVVVRWTTAAVKEARLIGGPTGTSTLHSLLGAFESVRPGSWTAQLIDASGNPVAQQQVNVVSGQTATVAFP